MLPPDVIALYNLSAVFSPVNYSVTVYHVGNNVCMLNAGYYAGSTQPQQQQPSVVVVSAPAVVSILPFGESPIQTSCPNCHNTIMTSITYEIGGLVWLIFAILCILGYHS